MFFFSPVPPDRKGVFPWNFVKDMEDFSHSVGNSSSGQMLEAKFQFHIHLMSNLYDLNSVLGTDSGIKKRAR